MCLILVAWQVHPEFPLVIAANRDEYYERPSLAAAPWPDCPAILGGYDLKAGGSWLACHQDGRFAAVTNVREGQAVEAAPALSSRGHLVGDFLRSSEGALGYRDRIALSDYAGFNLLLGDGKNLVYLSNRNAVVPQVLAPGIYGLSNHRLETPWPKLVLAKQAFASALNTLPEENIFFDLLGDRSIVPDHLLPQTGVGLELERMLSAIFVHSGHYGTRASTLLLKHQSGRFSLRERSFTAGGILAGEVCVYSTTSTAA